MAKVTVLDPCCDNQNVIAEGNILLLLIADVNTLCIFIDSANFAKDYGRISLIFQKSTDRRRYLSRRKHGCRHLIEQRLKEVVIRPINDKDFRVAASPANPAPRFFSFMPGLIVQAAPFSNCRSIRQRDS